MPVTFPSHKTHPKAHAWLKKNPGPNKNLFRILDLLGPRYAGPYQRFIDRGDGTSVEYHFTPAENDELFFRIEIVTRKKHSKVRFSLRSRAKLPEAWKKKRITLKDAVGDDYYAIDVDIAEDSTLDELIEFIGLSPSFGIPGRQASSSKDLTVQIKWLNSAETISLNMDHDPQDGDIIETYESRDGFDIPIKYITRVMSYARTDDKISIKLRYDPVDNPSLTEINDAWGFSTLAIDTKRAVAKATWQNDPPNSDYDGDGKATVSNTSLIEDLEFEKVIRRRRRQAKLREDLLGAKIKCCELSKETALFALDAAHIIEVKNAGGYTAANGLLLRADIHRLFDRGILKIHNDGSLSLSEELSKDSRYRQEMAGWSVTGDTMKRIKDALARRNGTAS